MTATPLMSVAPPACGARRMVPARTAWRPLGRGSSSEGAWLGGRLTAAKAKSPMPCEGCEGSEGCEG